MQEDQSPCQKYTQKRTIDKENIPDGANTNAPATDEGSRNSKVTEGSSVVHAQARRLTDGKNMTVTKLTIIQKPPALFSIFRNFSKSCNFSKSKSRSTSEKSKSYVILNQRLYKQGRQGSTP